MKTPAAFRIALLPAFVAATLVGCSGGGTTQDSAPTAPPITADNLKSKTDAVSAGAGKGGRIASPGIK